MTRTARMTAVERREQLLSVGRSLFAHEGYEAVSVEEIAAKAGVSKPIVYEHFGGKEGLYAVVVDREMRTFTSTLYDALSDASVPPEQLVERTAMALLGYIENNPDGFGVLVRDSPITDPDGSFSSLLGDVSTRVESLLARAFRAHGIPVDSAPYYAQMLVGLTIFVGQYWADRHDIDKETLAAYISNLAWNGLARMHRRPRLRYEGSHPLEQELEEKRGVGQNAGVSGRNDDTGTDNANGSTGTASATTSGTGHSPAEPDRHELKAEYKASKRRLKAQYRASKRAAKAADAAKSVDPSQRQPTTAQSAALTRSDGRPHQDDGNHRDKADPDKQNDQNKQDDRSARSLEKFADHDNSGKRRENNDDSDENKNAAGQNDDKHNAGQDRGGHDPQEGQHASE